MSKAIALTNAEGKHVGFLLLAEIDDSYRSKRGEWRGDCVFMALPMESDLFSDTAYLELAERKQRGEHAVWVANDGVTVTFEVTDCGEACFYAVIGGNGQSEWGTIHHAQRSKLGRAILTT